MITELAAAVHRGDASRAQCEAVRFGQQGINGKRYYLYLDVLVGSAIRSRLGTQPTLENIDQLAAEIYPAWAKIVRFDRRTLRDLLLTSCDLLEGEEQVMDYRVSGSAAAALGVLLRKPRRDLRRMSPMLGSFLAEHEAELRPFGFHD